MRGEKPRTQLSWMADLRAGDVIAKGVNGPWRIVREVSRYKNGDLASVVLVIRRCSWTRRGVTILNYTDLRVFGYRRVARNAKMSTEMDAKIQRACAFKENCFSCHEARGIA